MRDKPGGALIALQDLFARQAKRKVFQFTRGAAMALCRRQLEPLKCFNIGLGSLLGTSLEAGTPMPHAHVVLCGGMSLPGSQEYPLSSFGVVPDHTASIRQHLPQVKLGRNMVLARRPAIPRSGLDVVGCVPLSLVESLSQMELCVGVSGIGLCLSGFRLWCLTAMKKASIPRLMHN